MTEGREPDTEEETGSVLGRYHFVSPCTIGEGVKTEEWDSFEMDSLKIVAFRMRWKTIWSLGWNESDLVSLSLSLSLCLCHVLHDTHTHTHTHADTNKQTNKQTNTHTHTHARHRKTSVQMMLRASQGYFKCFMHAMILSTQ